MAKRNCPRSVRPRTALAASLLIVVALVAPVRPQAVPQMAKKPPAAPAGTKPAAAPSVKPDTRKAKQAHDEGVLAEKKQDWATAYEDYSDAVRWAPDNRKYLMSRELARSQLVQTKMEAAERDAISGTFEDAERELESALSLDPTNTVVSERLSEISSIASPVAPRIPAELPFAGEVHLAYKEGKQSFDYRGDTRGAYQQVARQFGVDVAFDEDLNSHPVRLQVEDVDFLQAMQILGDMTGSFWRPLTKRLFFVAGDTPEKRRDYDVSVVRTILLPASDTADQMTAVLRVVRDIAGITRSNLDTSDHSITLRASPRAIAIASDLVDELEQPLSELVLEIEVLEVDRNYAHTLGITPPQSAQVFSVNSQEVQEAQQSGAGLLAVLEQIFGTPAALSGLTAAQIQAELASGQLTLPSTFPFIVFGGGYTTFLARLPGAAGTLSQMLSLVQHGRRILLRAEDGQPATFFVGERYPIALGTYSPNLTNSLATVVSSQFPITDYPTGNGPKFVATASLRNNGINDLIVANSTDSNISVFLGNPSATNSGVGAGTFTPIPPATAPAPTYSTGKGPAWIATGIFDNKNNPHNIDLATANAGDDSISILIAHTTGGVPDGTFTGGQTLMTGSGTTPVSVVTGDFDGDGNLDLAVADQGDDTIDIFFGNGDGTFNTTPEVISLPGGFQPTALATGIFDTTSHFNTMGHLDLAVADKGNNSVSVLLGVGGQTNTFPTRKEYTVGASPVWVSAARLATSITASGPPSPPVDLAVANNAGNSVSILLGNGDGTFNSTVTNYPAGNGPTSIAVAPFVLSGFNDLAVTDKTDNALSFLLNTSSISAASGLFSSPQPLSLSPDTSPLSIVSADFNGDTRPDMAVAENGTNELSVILNNLNFSNAVSNLGALPASSTFPSIQYMDIGLKIKATPRVHPDGDVTLKLDMEISSLTNLSNNGNPVINNDSVEQTVRVKENETATLAGILEPQVTSAINGTPGLADLPIIGWLGKNQTAETQDTELLIMITPRMMELTPHKDHVIYAGQGASEGSEGGAPPVIRNGSSPYNGGGGQTSPSQGQPPSTAPQYQYAPNTPR
jgi:hypothetical protein